jgi:hypothetical protein
MPMPYMNNCFNDINNSIITVKLPKYIVPNKLTTSLGEFPNFRGRKKECIELTRKLNEHKAVVVHGIGGIGKSSFVSAYLDIHKNEFKYYGFINWGSDIKLNFFDSLQVNMKLEEYEDRDKNFDEIIKKLRDLDGKKLLIIDKKEKIDYREEEKVIKNILTLVEDDYKIIFISRLKIGNITPYYLRPLSKKDAKKIFLTHYPTSEVNKVYKILEYVDYHALFVKLIAKTLQTTDFNMESIIQKFEDDKGEFSKIKFIDKYTMDTVSFNQNLKVLFDMQKINKDGLLLLKQFSALPSITIEFSYLKNILNKDELLKNRLNVLATHGWLILDNESYKLHQIIKEYIISKYLPKFNEIESIFNYYFISLEKISDSQIAIKNKENYIYYDNLLKILKIIGERNSYAPSYEWSNYDKPITSIRNTNNFNDYTNTTYLVGTFFHNLGMFYKIFNDYTKAEEVYKISLELIKKY